jgi:hypothetical protein
MTVDLLYQDAEDVEAVMVAWLAPLGDTAIVYRGGDPLPFRIVHHIGGAEDSDEGTADPIVRVHTLSDRMLGWPAARDNARTTHRRILQLARYLDIFTLPDGRSVGVDYVKVLESPIWVPFEDDRIVRKVGTYQIGVAYTDSPAPA